MQTTTRRRNHAAPETAGFYISEAIAGAAFLVWCAAVIALCMGFSS